MTQRELGRRVGVCKQQIMRYEVDGVENMRVRRLVAICCVLSIAGFGIPHQFFSPVTT